MFTVMLRAIHVIFNSDTQYHRGTLLKASNFIHEKFLL